MRALCCSRTVALSLIFAIGGFCYAIASNSATESNAALDAGVRGVGTSLALRFTNPELAADEFDLGDAGYASSIIRYITAEGGLRPYRFTSEGPNSLAKVIGGTSSTLQLGLSGVVSGVVGASVVTTTFNGTPGIRFQATVTDAKGTNTESRTGNFNIFYFDTATTFRFAMDRLPSGRLAATYVSRVEVIGGVQPLTFSTLSVTDSTGAVTTAESVGLFVGVDGSILGRPLRTGTFNYTIRCIDSRGVIASSRRSIATRDQTFAITISDNPITTSDLITTRCSIRGSTSRTGRDSLRFSGVLNVFGQDNITLFNTEFFFRIGRFGLQGALDKKGGFETILPDGAKVKAKVSARTGQLDIQIQKASLADEVGAATLEDGKVTRLPLQVTLGDTVVSAEVIDFETEVAGDIYALNFALGRTGSNAGGGFLLTSVKGKDSNTGGGLTGNAWKVTFLAVPRNGVVVPGQNQGLDAVTQATVRIGQNFAQTFRGGELSTSGDKVAFGNRDGTGIRRFKLSTSNYRGQMDTNVISTRSTGIPLAANSPRFGTIFFPMGLDLTRGTTGVPFSGEHARLIFGMRNQYKDVPPAR